MSSIGSLMIIVALCSVANVSAQGQLPVAGYPVDPAGRGFSESFAPTTINDELWQHKDGWRLWDSWLDASRTRVRAGRLWLTTRTNDLHNGLLKVAGIVSKHYYSYGRFTIVAKASRAAGVTTSFYLYNEDKDRTEGGHHEEIDVELSSKYLGLASIVTFHDDDWTNDDKQNKLHRGGIEKIRQSRGLRRFRSNQRHRYVIDWQPGKIAWYVDGQKVQEFMDAVPTTPMQLHLDSHHSDQWDAFTDVDAAGSGAAQIYSVNYQKYEG